MGDDRTIAYFSMEIGIRSEIPTYAGGLGVLAGDTLRAAADLGLPMVAVTLLYKQGHFHQRLDQNGWQNEEPDSWTVQDLLEKVPATATVTIEGREIKIAVWRYELAGVSGYEVPVYFLDTDLPENAAWDRSLSYALYGGDAKYRLGQEVVLGIGGVRILRALGHTNIERFHMNEGHAAFLGLELLDEHAAMAGRKTISRRDVEDVREHCVFTTHTPVAAGHDQFPMDMVSKMLGPHEVLEMQDLFSFEGVLNMTYLALNLSHFVNGVARKHGEVAQLLYAPYRIDSITNGVHAATWTSPPFRALFDQYIPHWRADNFSLRYALSIPPQEIWKAHSQAKQTLIDEVNRDTGAGMKPDALTLGFARRAASYKRADLLFHDVERLKAIASHAGALQVVYAGKAHPNDSAGKQLIQRILRARDALQGQVSIAYLTDYDMAMGGRITAGVDVWLNTPRPPLEASGTSGMKAALNAVPSLSIPDGWWIEGCIEGVTGWAIGEDGRSTTPQADSARDAASLYEKLEKQVIPAFYHDRDRFLNIMTHCIALNGSFFNAQRMVQQYVLKAYFE